MSKRRNILIGLFLVELFVLVLAERELLPNVSSIISLLEPVEAIIRSYGPIIAIVLLGLLLVVFVIFKGKNFLSAVGLGILRWYRLVIEAIAVPLAPGFFVSILAIASIQDNAVSRLIRGIFSDLDAVGFAFSGLGLMWVTGSCLISLGLIVDGAKEYVHRFGSLPKGTHQFLGFEFKLDQFLLFSLLFWYPCTLIILLHNLPKSYDFLSLLVFLGKIYFLLLGLLVGFCAYIIACHPFEDDPNANFFARLARRIREVFFLLADWVEDFLVRGILHLQGPEKLLKDHAASFWYFVTLTGFFLGFYFFPLAWVEQSSIFYVCVAMGNLVWVVSFLTFHGRRLGVSTVPLGVLFVLLMSQFPSSNYLSIFVPPENTSNVAALKTTAETQLKADSELLIRDVHDIPGLKCSDETNTCKLIVVTGTGGGARASNWFLTVIDKLRQDSNFKPSDVGFWSTVSGSSVGLAHYLAQATIADPNKSKSLKINDSELLERAKKAASQPSMGALLKGFTYFDFWFPILGLSLAVQDYDRGVLLQEKWCYDAYDSAIKFRYEKFNSCRRSINYEKVQEDSFELSKVSDGLSKVSDLNPVVVMNTTRLETGRRTKVLFGPGASILRANAGQMTTTSSINQVFGTGTSSATAHTLFSLLGKNYVTDLWTVARASATFPYATPAGKLHDPKVMHLIDGGYVENFGIVSAVEYIDQVAHFIERNKEESNYRLKVLIIQIEAEPLPDSDLSYFPKCEKCLNSPKLGICTAQVRKQCKSYVPANRLTAGPLGPVFGFANGIFSRQRDIVEKLKSYLDDKLGDNNLETAIFALSHRGSLTWRLTQEEIDQITEIDEEEKEYFCSQVKIVDEFLKPEK